MRGGATDDQARDAEPAQHEIEVSLKERARAFLRDHDVIVLTPDVIDDLGAPAASRSKPARAMALPRMLREAST
jgi:hypothetical protein